MDEMNTMETMENNMDNGFESEESSTHSLPTKLFLLGVGIGSTIVGFVYRKIRGQKKYAEVDCGRIISNEKK